MSLRFPDMPEQPRTRLQDRALRDALTAIPTGAHDGWNRYDTDNEHVLTLHADGETFDVRLPMTPEAPKRSLDAPSEAAHRAVAAWSHYFDADDRTALWKPLCEAMDALAVETRRPRVVLFECWVHGNRVDPAVPPCADPRPMTDQPTPEEMDAARKHGSSTAASRHPMSRYPRAWTAKPARPSPPWRRALR